MLPVIVLSQKNLKVLKVSKCISNTTLKGMNSIYLIWYFMTYIIGSEFSHFCMIDIILSVMDLCRYINPPLVNGRVYAFLPILTVMWVFWQCLCYSYVMG